MAKIISIKYYKVFFFVFLIIVFLSGCSERKLSPDELAEVERSEIIDSAPIHFEYSIKPPSNNLPPILQKFSGRWLGRWDNKEASQLVVTNIDNEEAEFIFSWEGKKDSNSTGGAINQTALVKQGARLVYVSDSTSITFAMDTLLNKVIGVRLIGDDIENIVMQKAE